MPKNKKQKISHNSGINRELSQAEIWDDSALIHSWNDAVAEYEYYHSIHARGEDIEEVLRQAELAEQAANGASASPVEMEDDAKRAKGSEVADYAASEEGEINDGEGDEVVSEARAVAIDVAPAVATSGMANSTNEKERLSSKKDVPSQQRIQQNHQHKDLPQPVSSSDQTLENIKMAYYWAGYYSGLYDGQRQAEKLQDQAVKPK